MDYKFTKLPLGKICIEILIERNFCRCTQLKIVVAMGYVFPDMKYIFLHGIDIKLYMK